MGTFAVNELLYDAEQESVSCDPEDLHENELPGKEIHQEEDRTWKRVVEWNEWSVKAGPLLHRGEPIKQNKDNNSPVFS